MHPIKIAFNYLQHQWVGFNRHGIHSPFVYAFLEDVLYKDVNQPEFSSLTQHRKQLTKNTSTISICDLGAGSTINNSKIRTLKDIAKNASKPNKFGRLFYRMVQYYQPQNVLELGTSLGLSTVYFAKANPNTPVYTLEGCRETLNEAQNQFKSLGLNNIQCTLGDFKNTLPKVLQNFKHLDMVFFDGNHQMEATLNYFNTCLPYTTNQSIFIFDDIHWSEEMSKTWDKIKGHPQTVVTLDLFFIGIVFFDKRLTPQDFKIRF